MRFLKRRTEGRPEHSEILEQLATAERQLERRHKQLLETRAELKRYAREAMLLRLPPDSVAIEIGVDEGDFSAQILEVAEPWKLHLMDPWKHHDDATYRDSCYGGLERGQREMDEKYDKVLGRFQEEIASGKVTIHRAYSDAMEEFEDASLDWVYIDANHQYEFAKADLARCARKVKSGGFILGDDYGIRGWFDSGVTKAVDEFVNENGLGLRVDFTQYTVRL